VHAVRDALAERFDVHHGGGRTKDAFRATAFDQTFFFAFNIAEGL